MGSQHIQMLRVALFAALTIVAFGDHGMTTTAAAEPDTTTTVAATTTTTAPIAGERRADAPFVVGAKNTNGEGCPDNYSVVDTVLACQAAAGAFSIEFWDHNGADTAGWWIMGIRPKGCFKKDDGHTSNYLTGVYIPDVIFNVHETGGVSGNSAPICALTTTAPTNAPTNEGDTLAPSAAPTSTPSVEPSLSIEPSSQPSDMPSSQPSLSIEPSAMPSSVPSSQPSLFKCKECDDSMTCDGNHFLAVKKLDGTAPDYLWNWTSNRGYVDCEKTIGILNPLLSFAGAACCPTCDYTGGWVTNVGFDYGRHGLPNQPVADHCNATADAINQKIAGAAVVAKVACTATKSYPNPNSDPYISYVGPSLFVPGDITACKPVACALNDLVSAFDPDCPVPTAAPAFTQITQTVVQNVPGVDARRAAMNVQQYISAATFNADPNVKSAYQKAYGSMIGCTDTDSTTNAVTYKTGCSVDAYATGARRAAMNVKYISVVSDTSGVDTTTASNGVTDTSAFATAVATVVASDTTTSGSVTPPSASDIISVSTPSSVSISNAPQQTTCRDLKTVYQNHACCGQSTTKPATFTNTPTTCGAVRGSYRTSACCYEFLDKSAVMNF